MAAWRVERDSGEDDDDEGLALDLGRFRRKPSGSAGSGRSMAEIWGFEAEAPAAPAPQRTARFWVRDEEPGDDEDAPWMAPPPRRAFSATEIEALGNGEELTDEPFGDFDDNVEWAPEGEELEDYAEVPVVGPERLATRPDRSASWQSWEIGAGSTPSPAVVTPVPVQQIAPAELVLTVRTTVPLGEALRLCTQLADRWESRAPNPRDLIVRAFSRAILQDPDVSALGTAMAVVDVQADAWEMDVTALAHHPLRTVIAAAGRGEAVSGPVYCAVFDYAQLNIEEATPRTGDGVVLSLAIGCPRFAAMQSGTGVVWAPVSSLTLSYHASVIDELSAAVILKRTVEMMKAVDPLISQPEPQQRAS